jgi:hypothetical protein
MLLEGNLIAEEILLSLPYNLKLGKFFGVFCVAPNEATKKFIAQKKKVLKLS